MASKEKRAHLLVGKWEITHKEFYKKDENVWQLFEAYKPQEQTIVFKNYNYLFTYLVGHNIHKVPYAFDPKTLRLYIGGAHKQPKDAYNSIKYIVGVVSDDEIYINMLLTDGIPAPSRAVRINLRRLPADTIVLSKRNWLINYERDPEGREISRSIAPPPKRKYNKEI